MTPFSILQQDPDPFRLMREVLESPLLHTALVAMVLVVAVLWLALAANAYLDAARRDTFPLFWGLLCFLLPFLGYLIYLIVRPPEYAEDRAERELRVDVLKREQRAQRGVRAGQGAGAASPRCPSCNAAVREDFALCPHCGERLKEPCRGCNRALDLEWAFCPYCGGEPTGARAEKAAERAREEKPAPALKPNRRPVPFGVPNAAGHRAPLRDVRDP